MQTRKLGWTELHLTTIGLGTWAMGGGGWKFSWGPQDDTDSISAIHQALDLGINWIDTAAVYGLGHAEEIVGKAIRGSSETPIIATKCSRVWDEIGNISSGLKKESIRSEIEASLIRLDLDVIDLYQIHWAEPDEDIEEAWEIMGDLIHEGKIRYAGVSNFGVKQLQRIQSMHPVASLQPPYSMLRRDIEENHLEYCQENSIGVIAYSPMQKGLLTGKFTGDRARDLPEDDHRRRDPRFQEPQLSSNLDLVEDLRSIADKSGRTVAQLAIAWVLRRPAVTSAIVGARHASQIEETVGAGGWELSEEDSLAVEALLRKHQRTPI